MHGDADTDDEEDDDDPMSDSNAGGDSYHDSDSVMGSPACSSASEDLLSTPQKSSSRRNIDSPLIHHSSPLHVSDLDSTLKSEEVLPMHRSPFSMFSNSKSERDSRLFTPDRYLSPNIHIPSMSSPASVKSDSSQSYSIDALAKSSVKSSDRTDLNSSFECALSPLSSPCDLSQHNLPKFSLSTFAEDINQNLSPKKKPSGLSSSFSISTLSVSAVTPSRVHCTWSVYQSSYKSHKTILQKYCVTSLQKELYMPSLQFDFLGVCAKRSFIPHCIIQGSQTFETSHLAYTSWQPVETPSTRFWSTSELVKSENQIYI